MNTEYLPAELPDDDGELAPYAPGPAEWLPASAPAGTDYVPDLGHGHSASMVFGQPLLPGVTREAAQRDLATLDNYFTQAMGQQRIPQQYVNAAAQWFRQAAASPVPREWPAHGYDLTRFSFARADMPYVNSFANAAHKVRMPEAVVYRMLTWYVTLVQRLQQAQQPQQPSYGPTLDTITDAEYAAVMRRADADKRQAMDELRTAWGQEFVPRLRVVQQYFAGLPAGERDYLESAVVQGGVIAANSSEVIDKLLQQAMGPLPTGGALQVEIAQLESRMKNDRRAWNRDEQAQLRYRELLRLRDGK